MPQVAVAAVAATVGSAVSTAITSGIAAVTFGSLATTFVSTALVGAVGLAFQKKPKTPDFKARASGYSSMVRQATPSGKIIYGKMRVSGPIAFLHTTDANKWLHLVIPLACHEVEAIDEIFFDDSLIMLDSNGETTDSRFTDEDGTPLIRVNKHLGADAQTADTDLISDAPDFWTSNHRLRGNAYIYVRLGWKDGLWQNGIPNVSAIVRGKKLYDTRTSSSAYSNNASLTIYDYLTNATYGMNVPAAEIDTDSFDTAANVCEESVTINAFYSVEYPSSLTASSELASRHSLESILDTHDGSEWVADTATNEYIQWQHATATDLTQLKIQAPSVNSGEEAPTSWTLDGSNTGAFAGEETQVETQSGQSWSAGEEKTYQFTNGTAYSYYRLTVTTTLRPNVSIGRIQFFSSATSEDRYTVNGVVDTESPPKQIIEELLSSSAGITTYQNGKWFIYAGEYRSPTVTLDEGDLRAGISVKTMTTRKELFNTVRGVYIEPNEQYQAADFPEVTNATYVTEDNSDTIVFDTSFPYVTSPSMAQRLAKINLERVRQQIVVEMPCKLQAFELQVGDTVQIDNTRFGWSNKVFEVMEWKFVLEQDEGGGVVPGVDLILKETASSVWTWATEETAVDLAPNTTLPNPFKLRAPGSLTFANMTWNASENRFVLEGGKVEIQAKLTSAPSGQITSSTPIDQWVEIGRLEGSATSFQFFDLQDNGTYDIRARFVSTLGSRSAWTEITDQVANGKSTPPSDVEYLIVTQNGTTVTFSWKQITDLDLSGYEIRYGPDANTNWANATPLIKAKKGSQETTTNVLPGNWAFFIKAVDTTGNYSNNATVASDSIINPNTILEQLDHSNFTTGTLSNMVRHYTGRLTAQDQHTADFYGWSAFDLYVPTPVASGSYTTTTLDIDFDDTVRVWGVIDSELGPGVGTGEANPQFKLCALVDGASSGLGESNNESISSSGTFTNMVLDYRNNLIPQSQNLGSDDGWSTFDVAVPNPYTTCEYEAVEIDLSADSTLIFSANITEDLMPGETGAINADLQIDYRKAAESYDGFESWNSGRIEARYIKHKLVLNTGLGITVIRNFSHNMDCFENWTIGEKTARTFDGKIVCDFTEGNYVINDVEFVVDKADEIQGAAGVAIGSGGTTITFTNRYHSSPRIKVLPQSSSAIMASIDNISGTSFDINLFNSSGTQVSGTVDWEASGA
jgi:hypothetical protein